jgi:hypothetical protein
MVLKIGSKSLRSISADRSPLQHGEALAWAPDALRKPYRMEESAGVETTFPAMLAYQRLAVRYARRRLAAWRAMLR